MGLPMALNLKGAGHDVLGVDVSSGVLETAAAAGLLTSPSFDGLTGFDVLITMLPKGEHVAAVTDGAYGALRHNALHLDCSTIAVADAQSQAEKAAGAGVRFVDAPVSGGVGGASAGTLTFMVGGEASAVAQASKLFDVMGQKYVHCGNVGMGQAAKACNNMTLAISMIGVSEAFNLAQSLGLDSQALFDVMSTSSGQCWSLTSYCPAPGPVPAAPSNKGYAPGFAVDLMLKDLGLAVGSAQSNDVKAPLGEQALALYQSLSEAGDGGKDFSYVIEALAGR